MKSRTGKINRTTKETQISVDVKLDGNGKASVKTGINHLITSFAKHSMIDLKLKAVSKDGIDHHLIEDTAITLAQALDKALGNRIGISRFGYASVPMDESLSEASLDLVRRSHQKISLHIKRSQIEEMSKEDIEHFFQSLAQNLNACLHLTVKYGENDHHKVESAIKSFAVALRNATSFDKKMGIPSTKGAM